MAWVESVMLIDFTACVETAGPIDGGRVINLSVCVVCERTERRGGWNSSCTAAHRWHEMRGGYSARDGKAL